MSGGFFGSFFRRPDDDFGREPEADLRDRDAEPAPRVAAPPSEAPPYEGRFDDPPPRSAPAERRRLNWLVDFIDEGERDATRNGVPAASPEKHTNEFGTNPSTHDDDYLADHQGNGFDSGAGYTNGLAGYQKDDFESKYSGNGHAPASPESRNHGSSDFDPPGDEFASRVGSLDPIGDDLDATAGEDFRDSLIRSLEVQHHRPPVEDHLDSSDELERDPETPDFLRQFELRQDPQHDVHADQLPLRPDEVVRDVDHVEEADPGKLWGDGHEKETPPEALYQAPPAPPEEEPVHETEPDDAPADEADLAEDEEEHEPEPEPIPDVPIDEELIAEIRRKDRVVAMLLRKEIVDQQQVANAQQLREQKGKKDVLWRVLASLPTVDTEAVYAEAARVYAFRTAQLGEGQPDIEFARSVMDTFPEKHRDQLIKLRVLPYEAVMEAQTGAIKLAFITHDPTRPELHRLMQDLKLERFELRYAPESYVRAFIQEAFPRKNEFLERMSEGSMRYDLGASFDQESRLIDEEALEAEISRSSLINLFEATLVEAVRRGASDIHIYPNAEKNIEVHFRVDGRLGHWLTEQKVHPEALLAVIKDNAMNVDRFERDSAQDGFIQRWIDDALIRFRVSVLPIANAVQEMRSESIVIRVLDDRKVITDLRTLGLLDTALERFEMAIRQPHGMVILTGPTGSGKSTTLVAAMHQVVTPEVNVLTVEDPVEYIIPGVRQIKLNHKLGLEEALRAILRHDPDVVMVGEMRDRQTADLAIKLANTGHLTFSTLHTNDAPSAVSRLYKMGIEPFLIAYAINMVVAQRLIRTLCSECKRVDTDPDHVMLRKLGFTDEDIHTTTIYQPGNNPKCRSCKGTSYKGRRAVTEALYFSRPIRHMIVEAKNMIDEEGIRQQAVKEGMLTLRDSAREIVKMGETSITEMIRVVTSEG